MCKHLFHVRICKGFEMLMWIFWFLMCACHNTALVSHVSMKWALAAVLVTKREVSASTKVSALTLILDSNRGTDTSPCWEREGENPGVSFLWRIQVSDVWLLGLEVSHICRAKVWNLKVSNNYQHPLKEKGAVCGTSLKISNRPFSSN